MECGIEKFLDILESDVWYGKMEKLAGRWLRATSSGGRKVTNFFSLRIPWSIDWSIFQDNISDTLVLQVRKAYFPSHLFKCFGGRGEARILLLVQSPFTARENSHRNDFPVFFLLLFSPRVLHPTKSLSAPPGRYYFSFPLRNLAVLFLSPTFLYEQPTLSLRQFLWRKNDAITTLTTCAKRSFLHGLPSLWVS